MLNRDHPRPPVNGRPAALPAAASIRKSYGQAGVVKKRQPLRRSSIGGVEPVKGRVVFPPQKAAGEISTLEPLTGGGASPPPPGTARPGLTGGAAFLAACRETGGRQR